MYGSIVAKALILYYVFAFLEISPESARTVSDVAQFKIEYTFWLNLVFIAVSGCIIFLHRRQLTEMDGGGTNHENGLTPKRIIVYIFMVVLAGGFVACALSF
jgi:uncharacterized protein